MKNTFKNITELSNVLLSETPDSLFNDVDNFLIDRPMNADGTQRETSYSKTGIQQSERMENPKYNLDLFLIYGGMSLSTAYSLKSAKDYLDRTQYTYNQYVERLSVDEVRGTYVEIAYMMAQDKYELCKALYDQFTTLFTKIMGYDWATENGKVQPNYGIEWYINKKQYKLAKQPMPTVAKKKVTAKDKALAKS